MCPHRTNFGAASVETILGGPGSFPGEILPTAYPGMGSASLLDWVPMAECSLPDCTHAVYVRSLCRSHYGKWQRGAPYPAPLTRTPRGAYPTCAVERCNAKHFGRGLCHKHYDRWRVGAPLTDSVRYRRGDAHPRATLSPQLVRKIRELDAAGWSRAETARFLGVSASAVQGVVSGRTWRHI
jgi:hypothetical protein